MPTSCFCIFAFATLIFTTNSKIVRYQYYPCHYHLLFGSEGLKNTKIDVGIISNSRGMVAIDAKELSLEIGKIRNNPSKDLPVVWDLGKSWRGAEFSERLTKDFLDNKKVKILLIEINMATSPLIRYHERSKYFIALFDLLKLLTFEQRDHILIRISTLFRLISERTTRVIERLTSGTFKLYPVQGSGEIQNFAECSHSPREINAHALAERENSSFAKNWKKKAGLGIFLKVLSG